MRKPNYSEIANEFEDLMKQLNREGGHQYAAFCMVAIARFLIIVSFFFFFPFF